jgi:Fic family protein
MEALGFNLREEANLQTLTINVLKTSEIEGEKLNAEMVSSSIARRLGLDIGTLQPADRNVEGIVEMMLDATGNSASRSPARGSLPGLPPFSQPGAMG